MDRVLAKLADGDQETFPETREALLRFDAALEHLPGELPPAEGGADPAALDEMLAGACAPLAEAVAMLTPGPLANHWVSPGISSGISPAISPGEGHAPGGLETALQALQERLSATSLGDQTRDQAREILGYLERGAAYPELRPRVEAFARLLDGALDLADALRDAGWLEPEQRAACIDRLQEALVIFRDPATRQDGVRRLERLAALREILARVSGLSSSLPGSRVDLEPIQIAFAAAVGDHAGERVDMLLAALDRMIAYRQLERAALARELRVVHRRLDDRYRASERALLAAIPAVTTSPDAFSDPALVSVVADHKQYLEDLKRLQKLPKWVNAISRIQPRAAGAFSGQVRRLSQWLLDPNRRPDAIRVLDRFERQLQAYYPLPFEEALRRGEEEAVIATGGLHLRFADTIDRQRRRWAEAWAAGGGPDADDRMALLLQLTQTMADTVEVLRLGGDGLLLNRWAAWELAAEGTAKSASDLPNRLKLATAAAIDDDPEGLQRQLDRIGAEAPPAMLMGRLTALLADELNGLPSDALSIMGQSVGPPPPGAWMLDRRREIADLCRYAMEHDYARSRGSDDLADRLAAHVNGLAVELLAHLKEAAR